MIKSESKKISIITTITIIGVNILIFILLTTLKSEIGSATLYLYFITISIFTYSIVYQAFESFIYKKIKLVYKNIHRLKRGKNIKINELDFNGNIIENVNKEVFDWAKAQKEEIQQLKDLEKYRRDFLGNVSHELKTPIFNIQGYILTLLDGGIHDPKINIKYLEKTAISIDRMVNIIEDLETISALESGIIEIKYKSFNIIDLSNEVVEDLEYKAVNNGINLFIAKGKDQKPIYVFADKERIRQIFTNLIDNAIKYIGKNPNSYIKISFYDMDEHILIEISDNGMGISISDIPFIFDRFYRVDKARSSSKGGRGLGLSIVKHIIEAHKQTINVRSSINLGTTFSFTLKKQ